MTQYVRTSYRRHRRASWALVLGLVALVAAVVIPIASGAADKTYTMSVTPSAVCSSPIEGAASALVTIGNTAKSASLGSAEIYFPAGSVSTSATFKPAFEPARPGAKIELRANVSTKYGMRDVVAVRDLNLAKNSSLGIRVKFKANATFPLTDVQSVVKQSNNFNDTSGAANLFEDPATWPKLSLGPCVTISGTVWHDQDQDESIDAAEPRLGNWTVRAYASGTPPRQLVATAAPSDATGFYSLSVPGNASYVLCETSPSGSWGQTTPDPGASCSTTYSPRTEEPNGIAVVVGTSNVSGQHFGNVPTITAGCGDRTTGPYEVELGTGPNGTCEKPGDAEYSFETWTEGTQTFFKFVPLSGGSETVLVAEKLQASYTPNPADQTPQTTLIYDDDLSDGFQGVEMPYCDFDPRSGDSDRTTIAPRNATTYPTIMDYANAVLPSGHTSCVLEATQKVKAAGQPTLDAVFYVFSAVDGGRGMG
jgi:hypothetical protein